MQGAGGALCREKAAWLVEATQTWFLENANLQAMLRNVPLPYLLGR